MRNINSVVFGNVVKASVLSLALIGAAQGADIGFRPWGASAAPAAVGESSSGASEPIGFQLPKDPSIQARDVVEAYPGLHPWTDSLKCMSDASFCHRFDEAPVGAELAIR